MKCSQVQVLCLYMRNHTSAASCHRAVQNLQGGGVQQALGAAERWAPQRSLLPPEASQLDLGQR